MGRNEALITPSVIKWTREKANYSIESVAKKLNVKVHILKEWEEGKSLPTVSQARKMSQIYRRPFASFYLSKPPKDFPLLQDFRTKKSQSVEYSTELVFLIRQLQERQIWLSQYFKESGYEKLKFVGSADTRSSFKNISKSIIKTIWGSRDNYSQVLSTKLKVDKLFEKWVEQCEKKGIFISKTSFLHSHCVISADEARGFVISDEYAPFIFVHSQDSGNAQLFTLLHELAHLWFNDSGVSSDIYNIYKPSTFHQNKEALCNHIAAEILMPEEEVKNLAKVKNFKESESEKFIEKHCKQFRTSRLAFLIRLRVLGLLKSNKVFETLKKGYEKEYEVYKIEQKKKNQKSKGGPDSNLLKVQANGESFTRIVISLFKEGSLSGRDTSNLLDLKLNRIKKIESYLSNV